MVHPVLKCSAKIGARGNAAFGEGKEWEDLIARLVVNEPSTLLLQSPVTGKFLSSGEAAGYYGADELHDLEKKVEWELISIHGNFVRLESHYLGQDLTLLCDGRLNCGGNLAADASACEAHLEWKLRERQIVGGSLVTVGAAAIIGALAIPLVGFGSAGVAAGSLAAGIQSAVYGPAAWGLFSVLQSTGATLGWVSYAAGGTAIAGLGSLVAGYNDEDEEERHRRKRRQET